MENIALSKSILAIVTTNKDRVSSSSVPTFYCEDENELDKVAKYLSGITDGMVHDLDNGVYIIVRH